MADGSRQSKLAAAKKKLKEFQQKSTPAVPSGGKKKRKTKDGSPRPETPNSDSRQSPDTIHVLLKGLVSDLHRSNGLVIPSLGSMKMYMEGDLPVTNDEEFTGDASRPFHSSSLTNNAPVHPTADCVTSAQKDAMEEEKAVEENRSLTSTESLRQLSEQLNGLVSQTSYVNGESPTVGGISKEEEQLRYEELALALDSSLLTNRQLSSKIEELKQQNLDSTNQLDKERKGFEQRFAKEQGTLREQLQVHIQTIGILVSEKSELQTALSHTQQAARLKAGEAEELANRLHSTRQRMTELERTLASVSQQQKHAEKNNKDLEKERDSLKLDLYKQTKSNDELNQQNSEFLEKLNALSSENGAQKLDIHDLHKKLEMAELTVQQFSNQSGVVDASQQLQLSLEEQARLASQVTQLSESLHHLRSERDQYVEKLKVEGDIWQERVQQLAEQVQALSLEKERNQSQIHLLENSISELQSVSAIQPKEPEPQTSGSPTEAELSLQAEMQKLQQHTAELQSRFEAQVQDNMQLSRLNQEQEERLLQLEKEVERHSADSMDRQQILENMQSDKTTISRALSQNRKLKEQLAELQNGFVKLTNENMELMNGLQSEQHVKKELAKRLGQLQESMGDLKEQMEAKSKEAHGLQEQRDEYYRHLQQYTSAYQILASEKEDLQRQYLLQVQLMDRLQHDEVQGKVSAEIHLKELRQTQESLGAMVKENEDLRFQISQLSAELDVGVFNRVQGDGIESEDIVGEEMQKSSLQIPEDFENREDMVNFLTLTLNKMNSEREEMRRHLAEQKQQCRGLQQQLNTLRQEQKPHPSQNSAGLAVDTVPVEVHEALKTAMDKLQVRFRELMQEKADLKDRVEELEHRCIQLSGETDTIGEYIALYQSQRAILKQRHREKEEYISRLSQDKEEMKLKLMELQGLVMRLVGERDQWYRKFLELTSAPGRLINSDGHGAIPSEIRMEQNTTDGEVMQEISLSNQMELEEADTKNAPFATSSQAPQPNTEDPTAKQIMQLLHEIQNPQQRHTSLLENPCIPFFYRADDNDEVRIMII